MEKENDRLYKIFIFFCEHYYNCLLKYNKRNTKRGADRTIFSYRQWAKKELKKVIQEMDFDHDWDYAFVKLEEYMTNLNDYCEIWRFSHRISEVNPYDILIELCSQFLDYLYDNNLV